MTEIASAYGKSYLGKPGFRFFSCRSKDPARLSLALRRAQGERTPFIGESFIALSGIGCGCATRVGG
jgi:hypothetical protein